MRFLGSILDEDDDMVLPNDYLIESVLPEDSALWLVLNYCAVFN